jgi:hypothetical protein
MAEHKRKDPPSLEDRIRALEGFRYAMLGQINATRTVLFAAWHVLLNQYFDDPRDAITQMRKTWLASAETPRPFPGADPAQLDAVSQEYEKAIRQLTDELLLIAQGLAKTKKAKGGR